MSRSENLNRINYQEKKYSNLNTFKTKLLNIEKNFTTNL